MTDQDTRDRISAIGRIAILTSASEENCDSYVEVTTADARALLDERRDLADKLAIAMRTIASFDADHAADLAYERAKTAAWHAEAESLRAQRDAMETALNKAHAELLAVTRCGETTTGLLGNTLRPCMREKRHPGGHRNEDGTEWRDRAVEADLRAARDMLRRPDDRAPFTPVARTDAHFSPGYTGEIPDHFGTAAYCPAPACRTAQRQHEAANDIQDLTYELLRTEDAAKETPDA